MSTLKDRLRTDLTAAMKARDEVRSSTIRMVLTAITNAEVAGKEARELSDDDVIGVLSSEAKKRREAATAFDDGGRAEMADKERAEAAVLAEYLPEGLSDEDVVAIVTAAIEQTGRRRRGHEGHGKGDGGRAAPGEGPRRRRCGRGRGAPPARGLARCASRPGRRCRSRSRRRCHSRCHSRCRHRHRHRHRTCACRAPRHW